jgi:hypothetical protein
MSMNPADQHGRGPIAGTNREERASGSLRTYSRLYRQTISFQHGTAREICGGGGILDCGYPAGTEEPGVLRPRGKIPGREPQSRKAQNELQAVQKCKSV